MNSDHLAEAVRKALELQSVLGRLIPDDGMTMLEFTALVPTERAREIEAEIKKSIAEVLARYGVEE